MKQRSNPNRWLMNVLQIMNWFIQMQMTVFYFAWFHYAKLVADFAFNASIEVFLHIFLLSDPHQHEDVSRELADIFQMVFLNVFFEWKCLNFKYNWRKLDCIFVKRQYLNKICKKKIRKYLSTLQWRYNGRDGISNHRRHDCLLNLLSRLRSKKTSKLRVTGLCDGIHRWPVNFPHKRPVMRKYFHLMTSSWNRQWANHMWLQCELLFANGYLQRKS